MMARVIYGGEQAFNALVYQQPDQRTMDYFANTIDTASQYLTGLPDRFIETAREINNKYTSYGAITAAKAIISQLDTHINPDTILNLNEHNVMYAMPRMQEYIMVQPDMWSLNQKQMCSAFNDSYYNVDPSVTTYKDHIRYMEVMDGIAQFDDNGDMFFETYSNSEMEELHFIDQLSILSTWDAIANAIIDNIDPSDPNGGSL